VIDTLMTNQNRFIFSPVIVIFTVVIFSGCSSTVQTITDRSLSASEIIASVNANADSIQTFSAYGSINIETPTMNQAAGFDLAVKKPDSVRIIVEGPFGITVGKALFTKQRFTAYSAMNNTVYEGDPIQGMKKLPLMSDFPPEVLIDAMSGVRRFTDTATEPDSFYTTDRFYTLIFSRNQTTSKFRVDRNSLRLSNVKTFNLNGELLWEEVYTYQRLENGQWRPSTARIVVPEKQTTLDISLDDITINEPIESMMITIPEDAERRTIQ
jgi:outer membrane lipoprotein-sorting protein